MRVEPLAKLRLSLLGEELGGRTGKGVGLDLEPDQALGAKRAGILGQAVEVLAAVAIGTLGGTEPPDPMAELPGLLQDLELGQVGDVGDVFQLEAVAEVGPVAAKPLHGVVVLDARERQCELLAAELTGHGGDEKLQRGQDVLVLDERHLDVKLGELGLAVGSQVLVAEAAGNLEVAVEAGDHQQLLVELGRLRQRVEMPRVHPAGNQEVAGALGSAAAQNGRLDLEEVLLAQDVAHELAKPVADDEDPLHVGPAEVKEAILEAQLLVGLGPVHLEGRRGRGIVEHQLGGPDLDRPGLELGVLLAGKPGGDDPLDSDHVLIAEVAAPGLQLGAGVGLEDHLGDPVAVAQVDEDEPAEIAPARPPSR